MRPMVRRSPIATARYLDTVLAVLKDAGVAVVTMELDLNPSVPFHARLTTRQGAVLKWHEDNGWTTEGDTSWDAMRDVG
jgi:hypothetical protein